MNYRIQKKKKNPTNIQTKLTQKHGKCKTKNLIIPTQKSHENLKKRFIKISKNFSKKKKNLKVKSLKYPSNDTRTMFCRFSTTKVQKCRV